jgi:uncharacterized damage-inducible protein DinB
VSAAFLDLLAALAGYTDEEMALPWDWPGHEGVPLQIRDAHWRIYEDESAALVGAPSPSSEAATVMDAAQAAFGDLRGLLAGQPDDILDSPPPTGEWTLRQVLTHILVVDRRYLRQTEYATSRRDDQPLYIVLDFDLDQAEKEGGIGDWLDRLAATRSEFDGFGRNLGPEVMARPTVWAGYTVDVRFRLHRIGAHLAEHTIHAQKVLRALNHQPSEAREIVRRISVLRGAHERRSPAADLDRLDAAHAALVRSIKLD